MKQSSIIEIVVYTLLSFLLTSCSGARKLQPAPIEIAHGIKGGEPYMVVITRLKELSYINPQINDNHYPCNKLQKNRKRVVIKPGDSLSRIAEQYNMKMEKLAEINKLNPPYDLHPGQVLYV